jgi:hypothetical protein
MPWWSLPEAMRSACLATKYTSKTMHANCQAIFQLCFEAFQKFFLRKELYMMAYQTLNADGQPIDVIPATPDADPGWHGNKSLFYKIIPLFL